MSRVDMPSKGVAATLMLPPPSGFDFTSQLELGETISSATVTATTWWGTDLSPSGILSGSPSIVGTTVQQTFTAGVLGTIYEILCSAVTSLGHTLTLTAFLAVVPDA